MEEGFLQPYATTLRVEITEKSLPLVKANIKIKGIDVDTVDICFSLLR